PRSDTSEDADGDAHAPTTATCAGGFPADDCDDAHAAAHPGGTEICDGLDDDCNGTVDDHGITDPMCAAPNATAACARDAGACFIRACAAGTADCDADTSNGCETVLATDALNCGECSVSCGAGGVCTGGLCDGVTQIMAGQRFACALRSSGAIACWGFNQHGELGDGTMRQSATPVLVAGISNATQIEA